MGKRALKNRIVKLKEMEAQQAELKQQSDAIKEKIKKEMAAPSLKAVRHYTITRHK